MTWGRTRRGCRPLNWYWVYYASNGKAISRSSESYVNRSDCTHSISIMQNSSASAIFYSE